MQREFRPRCPSAGAWISFPRAGTDRSVLRAGLCEHVVLWVLVDCSTLPLPRPGLTWRGGSLAGHSHSAALLLAARRWSPRVTGRREKDS